MFLRGSVQSKRLASSFLSQLATSSHRSRVSPNYRYLLKLAQIKVQLISKKRRSNINFRNDLFSTTMSDMSSMQSKLVEDLVDQIVDELKCSKCNVIPDSGKFGQIRFQCKNEEHLFCKNCAQSYFGSNKCSECKESCQISEDFSSPIKRLIRKLPLPCENAKNGCLERGNYSIMHGD